MGFLDNLGRMVKNAVGDAVGDAVSQEIQKRIPTPVSDALRNMPTEATEKTSGTAPEKSRKKYIWNASKEHPGYDKRDLVNDDYYYEDKPNSLSRGDVVSNFENMLYTEFPEYEIRRDISPAEIGGAPAFVRYTLGMYKEGYPVVFIMITPQGDYYKRKAYRESKDLCMRNGIKFLNFFTHFENDRNYAINRIKGYL